MTYDEFAYQQCGIVPAGYRSCFVCKQLFRLSDPKSGRIICDKPKCEQLIAIAFNNFDEKTQSTTFIVEAKECPTIA